MPLVATMELAPPLPTAELKTKFIPLLLAASLLRFAPANAESPVYTAPQARPSAAASMDAPVTQPAKSGQENLFILLESDSAAPTQATEPALAETDLWQRLRNLLAMPDLDSPLVERNETFYSSKPAWLANTFARARPYLYHIVAEIEARGIPGELALLPFVESAYNPRAQSPANASGMWQFIPSTGKVYGLKQNGWYDGRRDVVTATDAALDYLERLHGMFGDWSLALAAYNCGEGCVSRAIQRNRARGLATDYLSLDLPTETRNYVPRLMAVRNIVLAPEHFGIQLKTIPNQPYFKHVSLPYPVEARTAARLAEMDMEELLDLNPGFRRHVIHAESQDSLLLPVTKLEAFQANLAAEEAQRIRLRSYAASKGELLTRIADKFDVTIQWLKDHNPLEIKRGKIAQAQTLMLPPSATKVAQTGLSTPPAASVPATRAAVAATPKTIQKLAHPRTRTHTVRKGDTLFSLAKRYKVTVADIREYNGRLKVLKPGEKLHIPLDS